MSKKVVALAEAVAICVKVMPSVLRWMRKPVALGALLVQERLIWLADAATAARAEGASGGWADEESSLAPAQSA